MLILPNQPWPELRRRFLHVEELGFDVAATADHLVDWSNPSNPWFEAWTCLAAVAAETSRIRIMTCVSQIPLRNPAMLAHQAVTLDHISNGRLEVGLGTGLVIDPSMQMMGMGNWREGERVARLDEYVEIVAQLMSQEVTTFEGKYYRIEGGVTSPGPIQRPRPPITIAAMGSKMMRHAVKHADTWNSLSFHEDFDDQLAETRRRLDYVDTVCREIGRDPATLRRSFTLFDPFARRSGGRLAYYENEEVFLERVEPLLELSMTEIALYYPNLPEQVPMFEHLARSVCPELKAAH